MNVPANMTRFYEVHYVLEGSKKVLLVEKASMSELDSWLCAILYVSSKHDGVGAMTDLDEVRRVAAAKGIAKVRWNRTDKIESNRPTIYFYGDVMTQGIFFKTQPAKEKM